MTDIKQCTCEHEFQDQMYGRHRRVFNEKLSGGKHSGWRGTVCGKEIRD